MNGGVVAIALILGVLLLAVGLIVTTLPLLSNISVPPLSLALGVACVVAGVLTLWRVRKWSAAPAPGESESSNRSFFAVLGIFQLVVAAASLSVHAEGWRSVIWGLAALGIVLCAVAIVRQPGK